MLLRVLLEIVFQADLLLPLTTGNLNFAIIADEFVLRVDHIRNNLFGWRLLARFSRSSLELPLVGSGSPKYEVEVRDVIKGHIIWLPVSLGVSPPALVGGGGLLLKVL